MRPRSCTLDTPSPLDKLPDLISLLYTIHTCGPSFLTLSAGLSPLAALSSALAPATISKVMMTATPASSHSVNEAYRHFPSKVELWVLEDPADGTCDTLEAAIVKHMDEANTIYQHDRATQKPCRQVAHCSLSDLGGQGGEQYCKTRPSPHT